MYSFIILTQYGGKFLGPIAKYVLGPILNGIFTFLDWIKIPNIGLSIIIFTIVVYLLLLPLTVKQQKFSKLQMKMQPEISAIQAKYKGKKDQESQMAMNQEITQVYAKYGVSPSGSCVQLLIQMPILFALYRVIYAIPAYVPKIKEAYSGIVSALINKNGIFDFINNPANFNNVQMFKKQFENELFINGDVDYVSNTIIDVLNRATTSEWHNIANVFPDLSSTVDNTLSVINRYNNFLGINIGNSPLYTIKDARANGSVLIIIGALLIPILSAVTQWINTKLIPVNNTNNSGDSTADSMAQSMKTMNTIMPIFSAFMCFSLPAGIGLYWIAGSVVRSIQQVAINKYIDKMDLDAEIEKNIKKREKKYKRAGIDPSKITSNASISTRSVNSSMKDRANYNSNISSKEETSSTNTTAKPGSIAAKANMVKEYNEKNNK